MRSEISEINGSYDIEEKNKGTKPNAGFVPFKGR